MKDEAPLISTPLAPIPSGGAARWLTARDGLKLRAALFPADDKPRGTVVLSPGRTEPIEKYFEVVGELQARGFCVVVHDWRGQGLSGRLIPEDRLKGHARGWRPFLDDYTEIIDAYEDEMPRPWIAVGHSMGGGLTMLALSEGEDRFDAAVLSAPMLGVNTGARKPAEVRITAAVMCLLGKSRGLPAPPTDPFSETFETNVLTHDQGRWRRNRQQIETCRDLALGGVTWGWIDFAMRLTGRIARSKAVDALSIPLTIVAAGDEKLVNNAGGKAVAERAPRGRYVEVAGAYHEVLMETNPLRAIFWAEFDAVADAVAPAD